MNALSLAKILANSNKLETKYILIYIIKDKVSKGKIILQMLLRMLFYTKYDIPILFLLCIV